MYLNGDISLHHQEFFLFGRRKKDSGSFTSYLFFYFFIFSDDTVLKSGQKVEKLSRNRRKRQSHTFPYAACVYKLSLTQPMHKYSTRLGRYSHSWLDTFCLHVGSFESCGVWVLVEVSFSYFFLFCLDFCIFSIELNPIWFLVWRVFYQLPKKILFIIFR